MSANHRKRRNQYAKH